MFTDRREAGERLLARLPKLDANETVIIALPRGGLPVADVIADALGAPLDIVLVRKVGVPGHPELALAAITDGDNPRVTVNMDIARSTGLDEAEIRMIAERELPEISRRRQLYLGGRPPVSVEGKTVVVVDDGVATGATLRAALRLIGDAGPTCLIAAIPVGSPDTIAKLRDACDEMICLQSPNNFRAVGLHYLEFEQVSDAQVCEIMARHAQKRPPMRGAVPNA